MQITLYLITETASARLYSKEPRERRTKETRQVWVPRSIVKHTSKMGWTKLVPIEHGSEYKHRHSGSCDKLNCNDMDCLEKGLPKWFMWITRWNK